MKRFMIAGAVAAAMVSSIAHAQRNERPRPGGSPLAQQALASGTQPDVLLDIPNLSVEEITLEVDKLEVHIALDARLANLLKLTAGADASIDKVKIGIKGVQAQATLIVRLENVRAIIERTLQTLDNNPQIISGLYNTLDNTVGTFGGVANNAVGTIGGIAGSALRTGSILNLTQSGLTQVSKFTNGAGQSVSRLRDNSGSLLEVITDTAGRIISSRRVSQP